MHVALVIAALACATGDARAQQPSDETKNSARVLAEDGERLYGAGDWAGAADRFARARQLLQIPTLDLWLARSLAKQGKLIEAEERYRDAIRGPVTPDASAAVTKAVDDARSELDALRPKIPSLEVVRPQGVGAVTLDGAAVPDALIGVKRPVNPGVHRIEAVGAAPASVTVREGQAVRVVLERARSASSKPPAPAASASTPPVAETARDGSAQRTAGWIGVALGAVGLGAGAVTGVLATSKAGTLDDACDGAECPASAQPDIDAFDAYSTISTASFIGAGIALAIGVTLVLTSTRSVAPQQARLALRVGGGGLRLGSF
jgi:hypothetical protein